jgi:DNA-directed RNA polymerase specialized sigma24 family protein
MSESGKRRRFCLEEAYNYYRLWKQSSHINYKSLLVHELRGFTFALTVKYIKNTEDRSDFCQDVLTRIISKLHTPIKDYAKFKSFFYSLLKNDKDVYLRRQNKEFSFYNERSSFSIVVEYPSNPLLEYELQELKSLIKVFLSRQSEQNHIIFTHMLLGHSGKSLSALVNEDLGEEKFTGRTISKYVSKLRTNFREFISNWQ